MRNICNIDLTNGSGWGNFNSGVEENEIIVEIMPLETQKTAYKVEVTASGSGEVNTSEEIEAENGTIYYSVPFSAYSSAGEMKIRLLSAEANSDYISFYVSDDLTQSYNIQVKYDFSENRFIVNTVLSGSGNLPSGGYKAGSNINISTDGTISVLTTDQMQEDNTRPITSAGVYVVVGNIESLLQTI